MKHFAEKTNSKTPAEDLAAKHANRAGKKVSAAEQKKVTTQKVVANQDVIQPPSASNQAAKSGKATARATSHSAAAAARNLHSERSASNPSNYSASLNNRTKRNGQASKSSGHSATTDTHASHHDEDTTKTPSRAWVVTTIVAVVLLAAIGFTLFRLVVPASVEADPQQDATNQLEALVSQQSEPSEQERRLAEAVKAGADPADENAMYLPTPLIASRDGLQIHTPIIPRDITEIEFHQASFNTSLQLTPLIDIVDAEQVMQQHGTNRIPWQDQPFGENPLQAEAVSTWRMDSVGDEMTAVDTGAVAGTYVYAPVTGTVVKIRTYSLFGQIEDYEVHIQSPDYPGLDIVMLHIENLEVEVGDELIGGCTRMATVRNIGDIIDNNLSNFTVPGDPGNHCHVQVNDATRADYKGLDGALDIFDGAGYVRPATA